MHSVLNNIESTTPIITIYVDKFQRSPMLIEKPKKCYQCVAHNSVCQVYIPDDEHINNITIQTVDNPTFSRKISQNEIVLTPVVCISPNNITFSSEKPAVIEVLTTVHLAEYNHQFLSLFNTGKSQDWKELKDCEMLSDRIVFKTTCFGFFTAVAQLSYPSACVKVIANDPADAQSQIELTVSELPGFKVEIPSSSVQSGTEITATVYYDDPVLHDKDEVVATAYVSLHPDGTKFSESISITFPIPDYSKIKEVYPEATLQLWHSSGGPEKHTSMTWEMVEDADSDYKITKDDNSDFHNATFHISHFTDFTVFWSVPTAVARTMASICMNGAKILSDYYNTSCVKSMYRRCTVYMTQETVVGTFINFCIAVLMYPFQDTCESPKNFHDILYDSGEKFPIEITPGALECTLELKKYLCQDEQKTYQNSTTLSSERCIARVEFDIDLNSAAKITTGAVMAKLSIVHGNVKPHECYLIKVKMLSKILYTYYTFKSACFLLQYSQQR